MKRTNKKALSLLVIGLLVGGISIALAAPEAGQMICNPKMAKALNLTPEQKGEMQKMRLATEEKRIDLDAKIKKFELQLREENSKDEPEESKVMGLLDEIGKAKTEVAKLRASNMIAAKKILTPEQREKARAMAGKWAQKRGAEFRKNRGRQGGQRDIPPMVRQRMEKMRREMGRPEFRGMQQRRGEMGKAAKHGRPEKSERRGKGEKPNRPAKEKQPKEPASVESQK